MQSNACDVFALLLYKNFLCRKRRWLLTFLEITIPIILFVNIWHIDKLVSTAVSENEVPNQELTRMCKAKLHVVPNNLFTTKLTKRMHECLVTKIENLSYSGSKIRPCYYVQAETNTYDTEDDLFEVYQSFYPRKEDTWLGYAFTATIVFENETADYFAENLKYKMKIPMSLPKDLYSKPNNNSTKLVYERGYAAFQICVDEEIIKMKKSNSDFTLQIDTQEMPNPLYVKPDITHEKYKQLFGFVALIALLIPFFIETFLISSEEFSGVNMLMSLNNISRFTNLLSWLISGLIISLLYTIPITIILTNHSAEDMQPFLQYGNAFVFCIMLTMNITHLVTFGIHVSTYFTMPFVSIVTIFLLYTISTVLLIRGTDENSAAIVPFFGIIFPNILLYRACEEFNYYERIERSVKGVSWNNMFEVGIHNCGLQGSVGMILIFSTIGIVFHFTLANYVYAINPGKYGIKKSPFSFVKYIVNLVKSQRSNGLENIECENTNSKLFEPVTLENCVPEIRIRKLTKSYRISSLNRVKKCALRDVSMDIFGKQTTVLFGYSGSGKTSLLSVLAGTSNPSEGSVCINGKNLRYKSALNLGFCPQKNILFPDLSIFEQLSFFNMLRNPSKSKCVVDAEITSLLAKLKLTTKCGVLPRELSDEQKRRLCLGTAVIGNPKMLILDEPTLGLDAESKRDIWNLLLKMNREKTIIIATNDPEEAEVLGDRVGILHEGELKCYGSPNYLKNSLGQGNLQITLTTESQNELETISDFFDPRSKVIEISHRKIILSVPDNNDLPDSLDKIQHHKKELSITGIHVSNTNLAKVYLEATNNAIKREFPCDTNNRLETNKSILKALAYKKAIYTINNVSPILIIITMFFAILSCTFMILTSGSTTKPTEIPVKLDIYHNVTAYYSYDDNTWEIAYNYIKSVKEKHGNAVALEMTQEYLYNELQLLAYQDNAFDYTYHSLVAAEFEVSNLSNVKATALYNTYRAQFTLPISINLVSNALLKSLAGPNHSIKTTYEELTLFKEDGNLDEFNVKAHSDGYVIAVVIALFLYPVMGLFVIHPLRESSSKVKLLQKMAGVSGFTYWGIMFTFDFAIFLLVSVFLVVKFVIVDFVSGFDVFGWEEAFVLQMLFVLFAVNTLPLVYAFSFWNKSVSFTIALLGLLPLCWVFVDLFTWISMILHLFEANEVLKVVRWIRNVIFSLVPYGSFFHGQMSFFSNIKINSECKKLTNLANERVCKLTPCCNMKCIDGVCSNAVSYFNNVNDDVSLETSFLFMYMTPILYFGVLCILESNLITRIANKIFSKACNDTDEPIEEQVKKIKYEIAFEATKVRQNGVTSLQNIENGTQASCSNSHETKTYEFFAFELKKFYGKLAAIKDASFGIQQNECFGLLGTSNAGKTTILKMITGEEIPNRGTIHLRGDSYLKKVGYCPQNEALIKTLNAYDHLRLFARLRGIPGEKVHREVTKWIERFELNDCASEPSETYSIGNKKRLNIAMALIGNPKLILLDEPTKNLDPVTKSFLWKIIQSRQVAGQSTLLTSNSMDECLALCKNIAVMESGKFAYIGSSENLKYRFGIGYEVQLKLKYEVSRHEIDGLTKSMTEALPCEIVGESPEFLKFHVLPLDITWRQMYDSLFEMKAEYSCIEAFSVITASYEHLFSVFIKADNETTTA